MDFSMDRIIVFRLEKFNYSLRVPEIFDFPLVYFLDSQELLTKLPLVMSIKFGDFFQSYTVCKMDLILRSIERRPQMQLSMGRRFKLQLLRRYSIQFSKMRNFTLGTPWLSKLKNTGGSEPSSSGSAAWDFATAPPSLVLWEQ